MTPAPPDLGRRIREQGPITVGEFMLLANNHYYATRDPFGVSGDFTTSPEISQIFGELLGAWLADAWTRLGGGRMVLCEPGPGRGTLMKDALRATRNVQGFHDALEIRLIETSPVLRGIQQKTLEGAHPCISWQETFDPFPALPLLLVANEFFDALPVEQYVGETKRMVHHDGTKFFCRPEGAVTHETSPASIAVMTRIASHIKAHGGAALISDYGYAEGPRTGTLQAVRAHKPVPVFENPGEADVTAHVDFAALKLAATVKGAHVHGPVEQGVFLKRLGAELRATALCRAAKPEQREAILSGLERLVAPHMMGSLFKVMAVTSQMEPPAGF